MHEFLPNRAIHRRACPYNRIRRGKCDTRVRPPLRRARTGQKDE
jgi:hypothetical protein